MFAENGPHQEIAMPLYDATVPQFKKTLGQLNVWLDKAVEYATKKKFEPSVLLNARLAPDQFNFIRQVQGACDAAKFGAARVAGKTPPAQPDTETTLDELRARINATIAFLDTIKPEDFKGSESRKVSLSFMPGKVIAASDYLNEMALPNFYFHYTTAYAILRHNGVDLGKMDFLGSMKLQDA
jgi:hypothetical protein